MSEQFQRGEKMTFLEKQDYSTKNEVGEAAKKW